MLNSCIFLFTFPCFPFAFHMSSTSLPRSGGFATRLNSVAGLQPAQGLCTVFFVSPGRRPSHSRWRVANPPERGSWRGSNGGRNCGSLCCSYPCASHVFFTCLPRFCHDPPCASHVFFTCLPRFCHDPPTFRRFCNHVTASYFPRIPHALPRLSHDSATFWRVCNPPGFCSGFATRAWLVYCACYFPGSETRPQSLAGCKPSRTW